MDQFKLGEAELTGEGWRVSIKRRLSTQASSHTSVVHHQAEPVQELEEEEEVVPQAPSGIPVTSPMNGIYYASSSPASAPFVREGDTVNAGQVIALIEAMKVFNEINAPVSGTVRKIAAQSGSVVAQGEALLYIG